MYMYIYIYIYICNVCVCVRVCVCVWGVYVVYTEILYIYIYLHVCMSVCMHACIKRSIYLSIYQSIYLSIYRFLVPMHPCIHAACRHYIEKKQLNFNIYRSLQHFGARTFGAACRYILSGNDRTKTAWDPNKPRHVEKPNEKPLPYSSSDVHICAIMHTHTHMYIYIYNDNTNNNNKDNI